MSIMFLHYFPLIVFGAISVIRRFRVFIQQSQKLSQLQLCLPVMGVDSSQSGELNQQVQAACELRRRLGLAIKRLFVQRALIECQTRRKELSKWLQRQLLWRRSSHQQPLGQESGDPQLVEAKQTSSVALLLRHLTVAVESPVHPTMAAIPMKILMMKTW